MGVTHNVRVLHAGPSMRYGVLGPVEVRDDGQVVEVGGPQQRRMLALLLPRPGQVITTARLVDCLWDDGAARRCGPLGPDLCSRLRSALGRTDRARPRGYRLVLDGSTLDAASSRPVSRRPRRPSPARRSTCTSGRSHSWRGGAYGKFGEEWWPLAEATRLNDSDSSRWRSAAVMIATGEHQRAIPELKWLRCASAARAPCRAPDEALSPPVVRPRRCASSRLSARARRGDGPRSLRRAAGPRTGDRAARRSGPVGRAAARCAATSSTT